MPVTSLDLEEALERIRARTPDPRAGLYGPSSCLWRVGRNAVTFLGGGRAALLQTAHPFVAHAVDQHSSTKQDPAGRFRRTFEHVFAMIFGDLDAACRSARRVHAIHERIRGTVSEHVGRFATGTPYQANDEEALLWVHATLFDTAMLVHELVFGECDRPFKERYYDETKLFGFLFGIPEAILPPTWGDFVEYNRKMWASDVLAIGAPAAEIAGFLLAAPKSSMKPLADWYRIMTAGLLPVRIREQYRMRFGLYEKAVFEGSIRAIRVGHRALPARARYLPAYVEAKRRIRGQPGRDRIGRLLESVAIRSLRRGRTTKAA